MLHRVVSGSTNLESKLACFVLKTSQSTERASFRWGSVFRSYPVFRDEALTSSKNHLNNPITSELH
jgi:hypothetical protein